MQPYHPVRPYTSALSVRETQRAIKRVKDAFQVRLAAADLLDHRLTTEMAVRETDELIAMSAVISGFSGLLAEKLLMLEGKTLENGGSIETERSGKY